MAGAGLIAIKRRIKSVTNTKKITKAMGLIATSKLRKVKVIMEFNDRYNTQLEDIEKDILSLVDGHSCKFITGNSSNKKLYLVFTSDSGFCGGYNGNIVNTALETIKKDRENNLIMILGQKGREYLRRFKYETTAEYVELSDVPNMKEARVIADDVIRLFENEEVGEVYLVYTKFMSSVKQNPVVEKLLPLEKPEIKGAEDRFIYEPQPRNMVEDVVNMYIRSKILNSLMTAKLSEHSSRMTAMDGASKNADDILEKLNLKYNRIRQTFITQEITEIVGGTEAQK
ncbi:ATP synthase F1 subunit gamma [Clostridium cadaveris]|uniref:ATP synthase F1 subunit gamma n=1 Tax=Clostridium cadaveris TaxID=1529 RepID=UPI0015B6F3E7|nr:ATP synthase F1 subunit gamma [Clostridium cadaveris]NWK10900.1 F0F1 ATP synthase subunit gamma [Clostridium cadaveris]